MSTGHPLASDQKNQKVTKATTTRITNTEHHPDTTTPCYSAEGVQLTISNLDVFEGHLRARVTDQHLAIQSEHDIHLYQVNHATHHVS